MPRRASDSVVTHRIELGMFERKAFEAWQAPKQIEAIARAAGYVGGAAALGVAAYGLFWFFDATVNIKSRIGDWYSRNQSQYEREREQAQQQAQIDTAVGGGTYSMIAGAFRGPGILWRMLTEN
jgi:hypothetical protein